MKFDTKYPGTKSGDEPEVCLIKVSYRPPEHCCQCRALTSWLDFTWCPLEEFVCSDECRKAMNEADLGPDPSPNLK